MRYFARIAYKGTNFCGWQSQRDGIETIQDTIEKALAQISGFKTPIIGCGRTDTGVHASDFYFHFDSEINLDERVYQINAILPYEIAIRKIILVKDNYHARFDAIKRTYEYHLHTYKDPFLTDLSYHYKEPIDIDQMNKAAKVLMEYTDFSTFCKSGTDVRTKECQIYTAGWQEVDPSGRYIFTISANRFLRGMVRMIVGMCLNVGKGKVSFQSLHEALESRKPLDYAWSVPAAGLFLCEIVYPYSDELA